MVPKIYRDLSALDSCGERRDLMMSISTMTCLTSPNNNTDRLSGLRICHMVYMETFKCLKIQKGQIISAKPLKIASKADFSPKWWVGTSDRTGQNSLKLVHSLLESGHDRKIDQK